MNRRFAEAVCEEADSDDPIILVQDYHFALALKMIRKLLPRATILTFWHIPWPNAETFRAFPWREELLDGLLGSSLLGFHLGYYCQNFLETVDRNLESRTDRDTSEVQRGGHSGASPFPISIDFERQSVVAASPPVDEAIRW